MSLHGVLAEFAGAADLVAAMRHLRIAGFRRLEAYAPMPIDGLDEIAERPVALPIVIFLCAVLGCLGGYFLQYWGAVVDYPINVGGRPLNSWPAFLPTAFEIAVLLAVAGGIIAWFVASRLPSLASPLARVPGFERATIDRFFLCVESGDPRFDPGRLRHLLERCAALRIVEVPA
jgi:Protein of unknown function (DUF3341)